MTKIMVIAKKRKLHVIEDCAQATGAKWKGKAVGTFGTFGCFSFYPTKILGAYGDGGAILTNSKSLAERLGALRSQGDPNKTYVHKIIGLNSRLDALQAAVLNSKLKHFHNWNRKRIRLARKYDSMLSRLNERPIQVPARIRGAHHVFHQYIFRTKRRDELLHFLRKNGVSAGIYYPMPLHLQPCLRKFGYGKGDFPASEKACREIISLPLFPQMASAEQKFVISKIQEFFN
jgi:dTDP-4-amino-4,6-dideoxygalactose transaminase